MRQGGSWPTSAKLPGSLRRPKLLKSSKKNPDLPGGFDRGSVLG